MLRVHLLLTTICYQTQWFNDSRAAQKRTKLYVQKEPSSHTGRNTILDRDMIDLIVSESSRLASSLVRW